MASPQQETVAGTGEKRAEGDASGSRRFFAWEEIELRTGRTQPYLQEWWLVIDRKVYDVSSFWKRHPGGPRVICHYAGQDATDAFTAFHLQKAQVSKYLNSLLIGELAPDQPSSEPSKNQLLVKDFRELRSVVEQMGLLKPSNLFFFLIFLHIVLLDVAAWLTIWYFGTSVGSFFLSVLLFTSAQVQMSWFQHDLGHLSVFTKSKWNHLVHIFVMSLMKGMQASWWNNLHFQHHAKPNCFRKDPDLNMHPVVFALGKKLAAELGMQKKKFMPYNYQHKYFFIIGPVLMVPFFQWSVLFFSIKRRKWLEFALIVTYNIRVCLIYVPLLGFKYFMVFYWLARFLESVWFIWISQMNHIPMNIDYDKNMDWTSTQLYATCNVNHSLFNDWFSGHLNFQIEHHLFPTMPRHNFSKVAPLVKSLCAKHGIDYQCKPLLTAFGDILQIASFLRISEESELALFLVGCLLLTQNNYCSLKDSGEAWLDAYLHG